MQSLLGAQRFLGRAHGVTAEQIIHSDKRQHGCKNKQAYLHVPLKCVWIYSFQQAPAEASSVWRFQRALQEKEQEQKT